MIGLHINFYTRYKNFYKALRQQSHSLQAPLHFSQSGIAWNLLITAISPGDPFGMNTWIGNGGKWPEHNQFQATICAILA